MPADEKERDANKYGAYDTGSTCNLELHDILAGGNLEVLLQPIFDLANGQAVGYEALTRGPAGSKLFKPVDLFEAALEEGCFHTLDSMCRRKAMEAKQERLREGEQIFVNMDPRMMPCLLGPACPTCAWVRELGINPGDVVFELTERVFVGGDPIILKALDRCRCKGHRLALDDVGVGYSGMATMVTVRPDYMKLDGYLVRGIATDTYRRNLIKGLVSYCRETGIRLVAECIETREELEILCQIGVPYGQGYFLAAPGPGRPELNPEAAKIIKKYQGGKSGEKPPMAINE